MHKKGQEAKTEQESTPALQNFKAINVLEYIFPLLNVASIDRLHEASQAFPFGDIPISKNHFISLALLANHTVITLHMNYKLQLVQTYLLVDHTIKRFCKTIICSSYDSSLPMISIHQYVCFLFSCDQIILYHSQCNLPHNTNLC